MAVQGFLSDLGLRRENTELRCPSAATTESTRCGGT
jgi:hypothetical protein